MMSSKHVSTLRKGTFTVLMILFSFCLYAQPTYCTSGLGGYAGDIPIDGVVISGTALNNPTPSNPYTYSAYPISGSTTASLQQGVTYSISVNTGSSIYSYYYGNVGMWIDFNQNGSFDVYEWVSVGVDVTGIATATFTVPLTAHTGLTGLRIRTRDSDDGLVNAYDGCADYYSGETEDYYVSIDTTLPCSGSPAIGVISGTTSICSGNPFIVALSGYTFATGISYQWNSAPSGSGSFTAIPGATNTSYSSTGIFASTDYQLVITCMASGLSTTSSTFTEALNPEYLCYCDDSTLLGGSAYYIQLDSVAIVGTTLNNHTLYNPHIYSSFPPSGSTTATLQQGGMYTIAVNSGYTEPAEVGMWIDYNHNGSFDPDEYTLIGSGTSTGTQSFTFNVPFSALTGQTGLRVRNTNYYLASTSACSDLYYGETEDYIITIDTTYPCTGSPAAGVISGPDSVCSAMMFTLTATSGPVSSGLTYQWESTASGTGTFTPIPGATNGSFTSLVQSFATDYELVVTCTASGLSASSGIFTLQEQSFLHCYCDSASLGGSTYDVQIDSVNIPGTTLHNYTPYSYTTYSSFPASDSTTATLQQGRTYTVIVNSGEYEGAYVGMWIDCNHNGTFDASEFTLVGTGTTIGSQAVSFTVPFTALAGQTGLRIRNSIAYYSFDSTEACADLFSGETEDYTITVDTTYPCTGTPVAGMISSTDSVCGTQVFTLAASGYSIATGLSYQWLSRASGAGTFTAITGATDISWVMYGQSSATDYELQVTCTASGLSAYSAAFTVNELPFYRCYCDSATLGGDYYYAALDSVSIAGTTLNNYTPYVFVAYRDYPFSGVTTATLQQSSYYNIWIDYNVDYSYYPISVGMWIDYNHNGTFDADEWSLIGSDITGPAVASLNVPAIALTGSTGMRIRAIAQGAYFETMGAADACTHYTTGTTQDYTITIDTTYPCAGTPTAGSITGITSICPSDSFSLTLSGYTVGTGITFQWESGPSGAGTFTSIAGAVTPFYISAGIAAATDYRVVVSCANSSAASNTASFTVNVNPFTECYCSPTTGTAFIEYEGESEIADAKISGTTFNADGITVPYTTGYTLVSPASSYNTATMHIEDLYEMTVYIDSYYYEPNAVTAYIDYNHSGTFDVAEQIFLTPDYSAPYYTTGTFTGSFTIPGGALTGQTGMRLMSSDNYIDGPCANLYSGEVIDFTVTIDSATTYVPSLRDPAFFVKAFPNPVNNIVTVEIYGTKGDNGIITLSDVTGRIIKKINAFGNKTDVEMEELTSGIYLIKYEDSLHSNVMKVNKE